MLFFSLSCFPIKESDWSEWHSEHSSEDSAFGPQDFEIEVSLIPAGSFQMGCIGGGEDCFDGEFLAHSVEITRDYYVMTTEVTQELYEAVTEMNPSEFTLGGDFPVDSVTWFEAIHFANELSRLEGREQCYTIQGEGSETSVNWSDLNCEGWRLLTEAEWEYAASGGGDFLYAGSDDANEVAWFENNSEERTHQVGEKASNEFGLYDMSGNLFEFNWDWPRTYSEEEQVDPIGASTGYSRSCRGGNWKRNTEVLRVSDRTQIEPIKRFSGVGIRLGRVF